MVNNRRVGIIIQARLGSTRLPNKVLLPLPYNSNRTLLQQIIIRAKAVKNVDYIIIATSDKKENDVLENVAVLENVMLYRGSEENVLERYYQSSQMYGLDTVVRLTADNPFIEPKIIEEVIDYHNLQKADYTTTSNLPLGCNIEVISKEALEKSFLGTPTKNESEHVTLYVKNRIEQFNIHVKDYSAICSYNSLRLTVDTESDYALACSIFYELYSKNTLFQLEDIFSLLNRCPWLILINKQISQKRIFQSINEEMEEAILLLRKQELNSTASILERLSKKNN